ncbi:unnamed protein product [Rhizoctonia solani]|uniref:DUF6535 domain-containing protein n=1 Tax=Rhizoctonia solani TaxID=456999 RepID=A0A8H2X9E9_9AGAM|nr:unnamed protein product [Rhizoctonia solani]
MSATPAHQVELSRPLSIAADPNHQRRRERDEYGAEMDPNARVWRVYVDETDKADKELVDEWNSAIDVMLVFAAVYSAILTAFVIESSKDLRPDYAEISARALLDISKALTSPETVPSNNEPSVSQAHPLDFTPTHAAIMVNTLWFLSLGLSIAVTLVAILAKEWCYSFMTRRTGAKLTQGRLRQKRWDGIKSWKMEEIIFMLPFLMHIALLLFAIGLSVYLWNINFGVSLPVILTTILTVLYYVATTALSVIWKYCPYTTAIVKLFHPLGAALFRSRYSKALFQMLIMTPAWIIIFILDCKNRIAGKVRSNNNDPEGGSGDVASEAGSMASQVTIHGFVHKLEKKFHHRIEQMHKDFLVDRSQSSEDETPMDKATSKMLLWMITQCEDPKSVDLALQALAGADLWLPCKPFLRNEIDTQILRKLERCIYVLESLHLRGHGSTWEELLDNAYLYSRALATLLRGNPEDATVSWSEWEDCMQRIHKILGTHSGVQSRRSEGTGYDLGTLLLEGSPKLYETSFDDFHTRQREGQWRILKQISTNEVTEQPPGVSSIRVLVNVITRTLLYAPPLSPLPLVKLFNEYKITPVNEAASLGHAIGIALTIYRFTTTRYAPVPSEPNPQSVLPQTNPTWHRRFRNLSVEILDVSAAHASGARVTNLTSRPSHAEHGQLVYNKLSAKQPTQRRTRALLTFGLLGLLDLPNDGNYHKQDEIESIQKALQTLETTQLDLHNSAILAHEDQYLRYLGYHKLMPQTPPTFDLETQFNDIVTHWLNFWMGLDLGLEQQQSAGPKPNGAIIAMHLDAILSPSRCKLFGSIIVDRLMAIIFHSANERDAAVNPGSALPIQKTSLTAKKLCIRSLTYSITDWPRCSRRQEQELHSVMNKLVGANLHAEMMSTIQEHGNSELIPYAMRFLWTFTTTLIDKFHPRENRPLSSSDYRRVASAIHATDGSEAGVAVSRWTCTRNSEFETRWFGELRKLCKDNPQNVLESGILDELTKECKDKCYQTTGSRPTNEILRSVGLPIAHDELRGRLPTNTWPEVYKKLRETCETSIEPSSRPAAISEVQETEATTGQPMTAPQESESEQPVEIVEQGNSAS